MTPIIRWTLWERKWSTMWWSVGLAVYAALNILVYSSISSSAASLGQALNNIPKSVQLLFTSSGSFVTPVGYLDSQLFYLVLPIMFIILLVGLGRSLIGAEEQNGTLELLLARPISRSKVITAKLISGMIVLGIVVGVTVLTLIVCCEAVHIAVPTSRILLALFLSALLSIVFGMIVFMCASLGRRGRSIGTGIAMFIFLASYIATSLSPLVSWLATPSKFLPYHFYQTSAVLQGTYNWSNALVFATIIVVLLIVSYVGFSKRDIVTN